MSYIEDLKALVKQKKDAPDYRGPAVEKARQKALAKMEASLIQTRDETTNYRVKYLDELRARRAQVVEPEEEVNTWVNFDWDKAQAYSTPRGVNAWWQALDPEPKVVQKNAKEPLL